MSSVESRIKEVVSIQLGVSADDIKAENSFVDDLGADSLDHVEIIMALEDEFEIEIDDDRAEQINTVQQAIDYITANAKP